MVPNANTLTGAQFLWASGPLQPGPCSPPTATNCTETTNVGSFTVRLTLVGLLPGDVPLVRIPVVNAVGQPLETREVTCPAAGADGRSVCTGFVSGAGIFPLIGGIVEVRLTRTPPARGRAADAGGARGGAAAAARAAAPGAGAAPPPPLPPPPGPVALEVPIIPESDSGALLLVGLGLLAAGAVLHRGRRHSR